MKKYLLLFFGITYLCGFAQNKAEMKGLFEPNSQKTYWLQSKNGDALHIFVEAGKRQRIPFLQLTAYPNKVILTKENFKKVDESINFIGEKFYKIVIANTTAEAVDINASLRYEGKYQQKEVKFKQVSDTTYGYRTDVNVKVEKLSTASIQNDKFYLNSRSNAVLKGGKNRVLLPIDLPENTIEWFYTLTTSRDESQVQNTRNTFDLASELTQYVDTENSLKQAVSSIAPPPSADICDVYLIDEDNAKLFKEDEEFNYDISSSRENYKSGIIKVKKANSGPVFIGINNPNNLFGIHVGIEVVAVVKNETSAIVQRRIPVITSHLQPYVE